MIKFIAYVFICGGEPISAGDYLFQIVASVDIAIYPANSINPAQLIRMADKALYDIKKFGRNAYRCDAEHTDPKKPDYEHTLATEI